VCDKVFIFTFSFSLQLLPFLHHHFAFRRLIYLL